VRGLLLFVLLALSGAASAADGPREGFVAADDGTKLFYKVEGSGQQVLVVVHGGPGGTLESVRPDFGRLAEGRTVIYYDQRGNGGSDLIDDDERVGINYHVADLEAVRRHFRLKKMALLGNSWGGFLISAYAAAHPDRVERLVLDVPAAPYHRQLVAMSKEIDRRVEERMNPADRRRAAQLYHAWEESKDPMPSCRAFYGAILLAYAHDPRQIPPIKGDLCSGRPEGVRRQQLVNRAVWRSLGEFDYRPKVGKVTAPVLVIHGVSDVIPVEGSVDWAKSFPNARLLLVQRAGHLVHLEQPDIFFSAVDTFLAGDWPAGAEDR
jgi:proline iminopeptidase